LTADALGLLAALCRSAIVASSRPPCVILPPIAPLLEAAEQHDVAGLVVATLVRQYANQLPEDLRQGLPIFREGMRIEAAQADAELTELLAMLAARGLPTMPFKGPLLAHTAYADPTLRLGLDLDLMVHPDDVTHVLVALHDAGYVHGLGQDDIEALRRYAGEYILYRPGALPVEPHWHPAPRTLAFDIDIEALWRRAWAASFLGARCYLPTPEDHLFLLVLHGAKERWHKLKWLADIAAFLTAHPTLDVGALRAGAEAQGCRRAVDLALLLSHRLFAVPITAPPCGSSVTRLAHSVLARLEKGAEPPPSPHEWDRFFWRLRERSPDRWRYAARTLFTPRLAHYQRLPLPPALRWLYGPLKLPWDHILTPVVRVSRRIISGDRAPNA
jgi:putative nucleotidyltransferase-like protein